MLVLFPVGQEKSNYFSCWLLRTTLLLIQHDLARSSISNECVAALSLTSVDDVCPNQIYHHPARKICFIMKRIHLLVLICCPNWKKYSPSVQIPNRTQNYTLPLLGAFCEPTQFSTLEPDQVTVRVVSQNHQVSGCVFVTATNLAAAATQATYLEAATAELQNRYRR